METTEKKKHKGGYELLKEKYAALEKERDKLKEELSMQIAPDFETFKRVEKERDEWKAKWQRSDAAKQDAVDNYNRLRVTYGDVYRELNFMHQKLSFLLKHCPFWVRWMYRKQFEKGGN